MISFDSSATKRPFGSIREKKGMCIWNHQLYSECRCRSGNLFVVKDLFSAHPYFTRKQVERPAQLSCEIPPRRSKKNVITYLSSYLETSLEFCFFCSSFALSLLIFGVYSCCMRDCTAKRLSKLNSKSMKVIGLWPIHYDRHSLGYAVKRQIAGTPFTENFPKLHQSSVLYAYPSVYELSIGADL